MNKEIEKVFTERGFTNMEQMATMFDYYKQEIERLNNIIDELEKYLKEYSNDLEFRCYANMFLDKLQELKNKEEK